MSTAASTATRFTRPGISSSDGMNPQDLFEGVRCQKIQTTVDQFPPVLRFGRHRRHDPVVVEFDGHLRDVAANDFALLGRPENRSFFFRRLSRATAVFAPLCWKNDLSSAQLCSKERISSGLTKSACIRGSLSQDSAEGPKGPGMEDIRPSMCPKAFSTGFWSCFRYPATLRIEGSLSCTMRSIKSIRSDFFWR